MKYSKQNITNQTKAVAVNASSMDILNNLPIDIIIILGINLIISILILVD